MRRGAVTLLFVLLVAPGARGESSLLDYEHRVVRAAEQVERIKSDAQYAEDGIPYIKKLLPRTETVRFDNRTVAVDNAWLWSMLDSYQKESQQQERLSILNNVAGRLRALDQHLRQAETSEVTSPNNEGERERLREILSRSEYQPPPESRIGKYIRLGLAKLRELVVAVRDAFWKLIQSVFGAGVQGGALSKVIVIAVIGAALIIAVRMLSRIKPRKGRSRKRIVLGEEIDAGTTPKVLVDAALAAAKSGDFRLAIRKLYVSLLYDLADRGLIELEDSATNRDYLARASSHRPLVQPMRFLTDRFDHVWYGMYPTSEEDFSNCMEHYRQAIQSATALAEQRTGA
jgi:hypothetical protein